MLTFRANLFQEENSRSVQVEKQSVHETCPGVTAPREETAPGSDERFAWPGLGSRSVCVCTLQG